jgi:hypothetical protein
VADVEDSKTERFQFGENWKSFLVRADESHLLMVELFKKTVACQPGMMLTCLGKYTQVK